MLCQLLVSARFILNIVWQSSRRIAMDQQPSCLQTSVLLDDTVGSISQLKSVVREFVQERNWEKYHSAKNLAMSVAIEAGELMEHFQWSDPILPTAPVSSESDVAQEIADVFAYLLRLADVLGIDLTDALIKKMIRNRQKYPIDKTFIPKSI